MSELQSLHTRITDNTPLYFRGILFLTFLGHGLASLGLSHSGYHLHYKMFESVNYFHWNPETFLMVQGFCDVFIATAIIAGFYPRIFLSLALLYLSMVAVVAYLFYQSKTGSYFGFGEIFRRFAWILFAIFLLIYNASQEKRFSLLRIGIAFAFLAHGMTSLGFFGLRGGQIELASQIFPEETAKTLIFYSGFSDVTLGTLMLFGIYSRTAAIIGSCWLVIVMVLSFMLGIPEGLFRSAFFLSCLYVALDARCHSLIWKRGISENSLEKALA